MICRLKFFRLCAGYSQRQLADMIGCSRNAISDYECGLYYPSAEQIAKLLIIFRCTFFELFDYIS